MCTGHNHGVAIGVFVQRDNDNVIRRGDALRGLCAVVGCRHNYRIGCGLGNGPCTRDPRRGNDDRKRHGDHGENEYEQDDRATRVVSITAQRRYNSISRHDFSERARICAIDGPLGEKSVQS